MIQMIQTKKTKKAPPGSAVLPPVPALLLAAALLTLSTLSGCAGQPPAEVPPEPAASALSPEAEDLVQRGIVYHDRGDYEAAVTCYEQALELAPDHPVIYYEMAFSYISMDKPETALELAGRGISGALARNLTELLPTLLDLKASALDNLGRSEEAVAVYLEAINTYGAANTLLYYNLAVSYYRVDKRTEAAEALIKGLGLNPNHASSNYLLGRIYREDGKKTQAFYALSYFLLLEPNTDRAGSSWNTILAMLDRQEEGIGVRENGTFTASDMVISLAFTLDEDNAKKSAAEKIRAKLYYVYTGLEEQKNSGRIGRSAGDELWWDFYAPFFDRIARSDYFNTFCRYIALTTDPGADQWIENGRDEIEGFFKWLNEYHEAAN
ncbi:MAG: tetratricopeptide repeat protein [Treponema sp.]|nr:tetratricopeptide repeat protein [Treponema sp.]